MIDNENLNLYSLFTAVKNLIILAIFADIFYFFKMADQVRVHNKISYTIITEHFWRL